MSRSRYVTAKDAATLLGVSMGTLYSYVSRGLIRSEAVNGDHRARRYYAEDIAKIRTRKANRRNPAQVAEDALHWGLPVLESALTLITDEGVYYRGQDVFALATEYTFEQVAALLWLGDFGASERLFAANRLPDRLARITECVKSLSADHLPPIHQLSVALALAEVDDLAAYNLRPEPAAQAGARILALMIGVLTDLPASPIAEALAAAWSPGMVNAAELINAALIVCADHELNASSFTARVAASADANPYAAVTAGLAALRGIKHGGSVEQAEALLRELSQSDVREVIADRLRRGERIPGFGHRLYPDGDPRAVFLLELTKRYCPGATVLALTQQLIEAVRTTIDQPPNLDLTLATIGHVLNWPRGGALALFALGRTAGWIGHVIEQYQSGQLIRPRARYIGLPPKVKQL
ncbi:MAG: citrate synthase [Aggregatilineales bacterium]